MRVLVVDDDESLRRALERSLRLAGYEVAGFGSAEEVLASTPVGPDTLLVLDVVLPGIDGIALRRRLAEGGAWLATIFITALHPDEFSARLSGPPPVAVLLKPFRADDLLRAIECATG